MAKSIEQVAQENPELLPFGWMVEGMDGLGDIGGSAWHTNRDLREQVQHAVRFLLERAAPRESGDFNRRQGSYGLKHTAEKWAGAYISNGALIAAALALGYEARRFPGSPNCSFNMDVTE